MCTGSPAVPTHDYYQYLMYCKSEMQISIFSIRYRSNFRASLTTLSVTSHHLLSSWLRETFKHWPLFALPSLHLMPVYPNIDRLTTLPPKTPHSKSFDSYIICAPCLDEWCLRYKVFFLLQSFFTLSLWEYGYFHSFKNSSTVAE